MDLNSGTVSRSMYCMHQTQPARFQQPSQLSTQPTRQIAILQQPQQTQLLNNSVVTYSALQQPILSSTPSTHLALSQIALHPAGSDNNSNASETQHQQLIHNHSTCSEQPTQTHHQQPQQDSHQQTIIPQQLTQQRVFQTNQPNMTQLIAIPASEFPTEIGNAIPEKISIYRHPLFPLLRILFEKCELATHAVENISSTTFDYEIKTFITQMAKENKHFFTDDAEVDGLMLKSLQVLRIHLLELEKVNELCKDFCTRYISCLKEKLSSENIMKTLEISGSPPSSPNKIKAEEPMEIAEGSTTEDFTEKLQSTSNMKKETRTNKEVMRSASVSCIPPAVSAVEISSSGLITTRSASVDNITYLEKSRPEMNSPINPTHSELTSGFLSKKNKCGKRGVLPKSATNIMKAWLFQHLVHPYPTEDEKKALAQQCNLSNLQVNNWFINARRRILQPMLDTSNCHLKNNKKSKQQRNAARKDWTNTIGVYNAYRTEALQAHAGQAQQEQQQEGQTSQQSTVVQSTTEQQNKELVIEEKSQGTTTLVNLPHIVHKQPTHSIVLNKPVQFVQLPDLLPVVPIQSSYIPLISTMSTQIPTVMATTQPSSITVSSVQTVSSEALVRTNVAQT